MPIFTNPTLFPTFHELPTTTSPQSPSPTPTHFLLAQIKQDMTITKPTVIATDRSATDFAITFADGDHRGLPPSSSSPRLKKGHTLVIPDAVRVDRGREGKKDVVRVAEGKAAGVRVLPGGLERVVELGAVLAAAAAEEKGKGRCAACGKGGEEEEEGEGEGGKGALLRCTGCGAAAYCGKECQVRGWTELGHKANCKVIKAIREIWP